MNVNECFDMSLVIFIHGIVVIEVVCYVSVAEMLIDYGADVNYQSGSGKTR